MVCKCGHASYQHKGFENECLAPDCTCPKFDLNLDLNSKMQPVWNYGAWRVFVKESDRQHDLLQRLQHPYVLDVHSKEYMQHHTGAHGIEIAILIADKDFDPRMWQQYRNEVLDQADRADAAEKERDELRKKLDKYERSSKRRSKNGKKQ